LTESTLIKA